MKKNYVKPQVEVVKVDVQQMIALSARAYKWNDYDDDDWTEE